MNVTTLTNLDHHLKLIDDVIDELERAIFNYTDEISTFSYSVGDIVKVIINERTKQKAFAYIHAIDIKEPSLMKCTARNGNIFSVVYGVEFFNYKPKRKYIESAEFEQIRNGYIGNVQIFKPLNEGYGYLVNRQQIVGSPIWNDSKSLKTIAENKSYNHQVFVRAAKYGDIKMIKYMMSMPNYPNNPTIFNYIYYNKANKKQSIHTKMSAFYAAVFYNHYDIVQLFLTQKQANHQQYDSITVFDKDVTLPKFKRILNCDVLKCSDIKYSNVQFYNEELFNKLCKDSNIKMLDILLKYDGWPIYSANSQTLFNVCATGNFKVLKLLLSYIRNPYLINIALPYEAPRDSIGVVPTPQTVLNLMNTAISYKRLNIIRYLLTEWKYKEFIIKNKPIYYDDKPHTLPLLLYAIMDSNIKYLNSFTLPFIKLLISVFDSYEIGLNWICGRCLNKQRHKIFGQVSHQKCVLFKKLHIKSPQVFKTNILWINRGMMIGSLLSAVVYQSQILWKNWTTFYSNNNQVGKDIQQLIWLLIKGGLNFELVKDDKRIKNQIFVYNYNSYHKRWGEIDLDKDICSNKQFMIFMKNTVSKCIENYRLECLDAFILFCNHNYCQFDDKIIEIFKSDILDFIIYRNDVLDYMKYFAGAQSVK